MKSMDKSSPKNHSYVCIPADKLEAIIETGCPPVSGYERCTHCIGTDGDCIACWRAWLKGGDSDAKEN